MEAPQKKTSEIELNFLRENRRLAPADRFLSREAILVDDAEMFFGLFLHFARWMALEAEEYFEQHADGARMHREVQQVTARRDHTRELRQAIGQLHIFQRTGSHNQIQRLVSERQTEQVALRK